MSCKSHADAQCRLQGGGGFTAPDKDEVINWNIGKNTKLI